MPCHYDSASDSKNLQAEQKFAAMQDKIRLLKLQNSHVKAEAPLRLTTLYGQQKHLSLLI